MKVILSSDIKGVGKRDEVVNVSEGYARNFLFPRKLAAEANEANMGVLQKRIRAEEVREEKALEEARETGARLAGIRVDVIGKVGTGSRLYGSITNADIASALEKQFGIRIDKRSIELDEPIRSLGEFEAPVRLHRQVTVRLKIHVAAG